MAFDAVIGYSQRMKNSMVVGVNPGAKSVKYKKDKGWIRCLMQAQMLTQSQGGIEFNKE